MKNKHLKKYPKPSKKGAGSIIFKNGVKNLTPQKTRTM
jgi:hypothetical protein